MTKLSGSRKIVLVAIRMLLIVTFVDAVPCAVDAQSMWVNREERGGFAIEYLRPGMKGDLDIRFLSGIYVMSLRTRVSDRMHLVAELPFVHLSYSDEFFGDQSSTDIGNPYLAVAMGSPDSGTMVEVGAHLPLADENAEGLIFGAFADIDRLEMYAPSSAAIGARVDYTDPLTKGFGLRLRIGPSLTFPTGDFGDENDFHLLYGLAGVFGSAQTSVSVGLTGRWNVSGEGGSFGENSVNQGTVRVSHGFRAARVGAQLRIPLDDDLDDIVEHVLGLSVTLPFR